MCVCVHARLVGIHVETLLTFRQDTGIRGTTRDTFLFRGSSYDVKKHVIEEKSKNKVFWGQFYMMIERHCLDSIVMETIKNIL